MQISPDKPERVEELDRTLNGPRTSTTPTVDSESGLRPPAWWGGDEEASQSSLAAFAVG